LKEIGRQVVNWIRMPQNRLQWWVLVNTVMNLQIPWKGENFLDIWETT